MIKRLLNQFWSMRTQFAKYFIIGFSAFILDLGGLFILKEQLHLSPVIIIACTQPFLIGYVFFLNKHWSFKSSGVTHTQFIRFAILVGFNYIFSIFWMWMLNKQLQLNYLVARLVNVILAVTWNFLLYKYWVYKSVNSDSGRIPL